MSVCLTGYTHPKFYNPKIKFLFNMKAAFQCNACNTLPETLLFILRLLSVVGSNVNKEGYFYLLIISLQSKIE